VSHRTLTDHDLKEFINLSREIFKRNIEEKSKLVSQFYETLIIKVFKLEIDEDWEMIMRIEQGLRYLKDKEYLICNWFDSMEDS
jgi:hypothetical protein